MKSGYSNLIFCLRRAARLVTSGLSIESLMFGEKEFWQARRMPAGPEGGCTAMRKSLQIWLPLVVVCLIPALASAQVYQGGGSFKVQCPTATIRHPGTTATGGTGTVVNLTPDTAEVPYTGPVVRTATKDPSGTHTFAPALTFADSGGAIKCQEISGGDGMMTEADGNQTFMFSFGPLSGLGLIQNGQPGTAFAADFNSPYTAGDASGNYLNGQPNPLFDGTSSASLARGANAAITDPAGIMNTGVINGNIPAPLMAVDEDDEYFLTLTNVGMIMRPDLFEQHTVHFHVYPNASSFYDGVPDASIAINIGGSFTYYYLAPDAGTYFWHCHITPPEHLQMGMVGQLYVRPRQNRVPATTTLNAALVKQQGDLRTACRRPGDGAAPVVTTTTDMLCSNPVPAVATTATGGGMYAYNDGDGSTRYDVEYPIQIHGFDPNFHFVGMTFNPEGFTDMKDKYFLLNGRSYPDTVTAGPLQTVAADGVNHFSQPLPAIINITAGQRALLRISDLDVSEYQTLASLGIPMQVIGYNAKLLRDQAGNNLYYTTNSITLGGGESLDVILDSCAVRASPTSCTTPMAKGTYFLYTPNLDHLSNDAENFGGLMTAVNVN